MTDETWVQITRDFNAPIQNIWNMWTDPEQFRRWYGPNGFTVPVAEMDVTVGGTRKTSMEVATPEQMMTMWFTGTHNEVSAPHRLVYTESMSDADGNVLSPSDLGMPPGTPEVTEVWIDLSETDGGTRMVMTHKGVPAGSPGEGGWVQAFEKLAALL